MDITIYRLNPFYMDFTIDRLKPCMRYVDKNSCPKLKGDSIQNVPERLL